MYVFEQNKWQEVDISPIIGPQDKDLWAQVWVLWTITNLGDDVDQLIN